MSGSSDNDDDSSFDGLSPALFFPESPHITETSSENNQYLISCDNPFNPSNNNYLGWGLDPNFVSVEKSFSKIPLQNQCNDISINNNTSSLLSHHNTPPTSPPICSLIDISNSPSILPNLATDTSSRTIASPPIPILTSEKNSLSPFPSAPNYLPIQTPQPIPNNISPQKNRSPLVGFSAPILIQSPNQSFQQQNQQQQQLQQQQLQQQQQQLQQQQQQQQEYQNKKKRPSTVSCVPDEKLDAEQLAKRLRRRERNKESAQQSRQRKKQFVDELTFHVQSLTTENSTLAAQVRDLTTENAILKQTLQLHQIPIPTQSNRSTQQTNQSSVPTTPSQPLQFDYIQSGSQLPSTSQSKTISYSSPINPQFLSRGVALFSVVLLTMIFMSPSQTSIISSTSRSLKTVGDETSSFSEDLVVRTEQNPLSQSLVNETSLSLWNDSSSITSEKELELKPVLASSSSSSSTLRKKKGFVIEEGSSDDDEDVETDWRDIALSVLKSLPPNATVEHRFGTLLPFQITDFIKQHSSSKSRYFFCPEIHSFQMEHYNDENDKTNQTFSALSPQKFKEKNFSPETAFLIQDDSKEDNNNNKVHDNQSLVPRDIGVSTTNGKRLKRKGKNNNNNNNNNPAMTFLFPSGFIDATSSQKQQNANNQPGIDEVSFPCEFNLNKHISDIHAIQTSP